ncbi:hypothetical protein ABCS02_11800 [Microbacterium sp. X-17]|uniref:hypothetical protein n=1 Tax=Microbacterium sp. X-17 TaxID=3144404 RepID=UPI0031F571ED
MADSGDSSHQTDDAAEVGSGTRVLTFATWAWLFILTTIGVVQLLRYQWGDAIIFGTAALVLGVDLALPHGRRRARRLRLPLLLATAAIAAIPLVLLPRHSVALAIPMIAVGALAILAAWPGGTRTRRPWSRPLRALAISWVAIWIAGCLWEIAEVTLGGIAPGGRSAYPALSDILNPVLDDVIGKAVFVVVWLAVGVFLVRRAVSR